MQQTLLTDCLGSRADVYLGVGRAAASSLLQTITYNQFYT